MRKVMLLLLSALLISLSIVSCGKSGPSAKIDGEATFSNKAGQAFESTAKFTVKLDRTSLKAAIAADASLAGWLDTDAATELAKLNATADTDKVALKASKKADAGATEIEIKLVGTPTVATKEGEPVKFSLTIPKDQLKDDEPADALKVSGEISIAVEQNAKIIDKTDTKVGVKPKTGNPEDLVFSVGYSLGTASFKAPNAAAGQLAGKTVAYADGADLSSWFGVAEADKVAVTADGAINAGDTSFRAKFKMAKENIATLAEDFNKSYTLTIDADKLENTAGKGITIADAAMVYVFVAAGKETSATLNNVTVSGNVYSPIEQKELNIKLSDDVFKHYMSREQTVDGVTSPVSYAPLISNGTDPLPEDLEVELKADVNAADTEMTLIIKGTPLALANNLLNVTLPGSILASGVEYVAPENEARSFAIKAGARVYEASLTDNNTLGIELWPGLVVNETVHIQAAGQTFKAALESTDVLTIPTAISQGLALVGLSIKAESVEADGTLKVSITTPATGVPASVTPGKHSLSVSGIVVPQSFFSDGTKIDLPVGPITLDAVIADKFGTTAARKLNVETKADGNYVERRQANAAHIAGNGIVITDGAADTAEAGKKIITVNLDCPINDLKTDTQLGVSTTSIEKVIGIGIKASSKITDITKLTFYGHDWNPEATDGYTFQGSDTWSSSDNFNNDVYEAKTLCNLSDGEFVFWADAATAAMNNGIAKTFTLKADGFEPVTYIVKIVETSAKSFDPQVRKLPVIANANGNYVEKRQANTDYISNVAITNGADTEAGKKIITVTLDCLDLTQDKDFDPAITSTADAGAHAWIGLGIKPAADITDIKVLSFDDYKFVGDGTNVKPAGAPADYVDDVYEAKTLCNLSDGEFVLWVKADEEGVTREFTLKAAGYNDVTYIVKIKEAEDFNLTAKKITVTPDANGNYVERRQVNTDCVADISVSTGENEGTSANPITITVTLDNKVADLAADNVIGASDKTNKIFGIGLTASANITDITKLTYKPDGGVDYPLQGSDTWSSSDSGNNDVYEAKTLCGLAAGDFVLWLNADEIAAATPAPKKFSLKADGYRETFYQVVIKEPSTSMKYAKIAASEDSNGNYVERRQAANTKHIKRVGFADGEGADADVTIINVYLDCPLATLKADNDTAIGGTSTNQIIGIGLMPYGSVNIFGEDGIYYDGDGDGAEFARLYGDGDLTTAGGDNDDEYEAKTLCGLAEGCFVLWLNADEIAAVNPAPKYFSLKQTSEGTVTKYKVVVIPAAN